MNYNEYPQQNANPNANPNPNPTDSPKWGAAGQPYTPPTPPYNKGAYQVQKKHGSHRVYATVLKILAYIAIFLLPLIGAIIVMSAYRFDIEGVTFGFLTFIVGVAVLWVVLSYKVYMFDNISRLTDNSEIIVSLLKEKKIEDKDR
jgi:hypothetical protein